MSPSNRRIQRFFGSQSIDSARIRTFKTGLVERIERESTTVRSVEDLERFISKRANLLHITPPRPMRVSEPERELDALYDSLLGADHTAGRGRSLTARLVEKFDRAGLGPKVVREIRIPVPIFHTVIEAPFGFQNGRFNILRPVRFQSQAKDHIQRTAAMYAVEGKSIFDDVKDDRFGELQLAIVGQFRPGDQDSPSLVADVFARYKVKLYRSTELQRLVDEIRTTGKDIVGPRGEVAT